MRYPFSRVPPGAWLVILASAALHGGLVYLLVQASLASGRGNDLKEKALITRLVRKGEEKPKNWLPDKPLAPAPEAPPPSPAPAVAPDAAKSAAPAPKKTERKQDLSKAQKNALAALGRPDEGRTSDEKPAGSPNGVEEGDADRETLGNAYYTLIYRQVKQNYVVPGIISERERLFLNATLLIRLDASGRLIGEPEFEKRSGNDLFDSAVLGAVKKSAPFPPPPPPLADAYRKDGIGMIFSAAKM